VAKRLWIAVGFAAGYVVGSAAGRAQYERIKSAAQDLWQRPQVQNTVKKVDTFVGEKAPVAHDLGAALVESVNDSSPESTGSESSSDPKPSAPKSKEQPSSGGDTSDSGATS
jgi:hypothetical protein